MSKYEFNFSGVDCSVIIPRFGGLKEPPNGRVFCLTMRVWRTSKSKVGKRKVLVTTRVDL